MFNGFFQKTYKKLSFEDVKYIISRPKDFVLISTLPSNEQQCLIQNTISDQSEEKIINEYFQKDLCYQKNYLKK